MKRMKSLIIAGLGVLILGIATVPASAQTWQRNRSEFPNQQSSQFRIDRRERRFERRRFDDFRDNRRAGNDHNRFDRNRFNRNWRFNQSQRSKNRFQWQHRFDRMSR